MSHVKYPKIPTSTQEWDSKRCRAFNKATKWVVTEKVHGANFALHCTGGPVFCAKRDAILDPLRDDFFNFQTVLHSHQQRVTALFQHMRAATPEVVQLSVYGELFGGYYPEISPKAAKNEAVQDGIYYSPDVDFYAFDIAVTTPTSHRFLDFEQALQLLEQFGFFAAKPLSVGSYTEVMSHTNQFPTTIPRRLGLPELVNNICEGVVIRPLQEIAAPLLSGGGVARPIIKSKNPKYSEELAGATGEKARVEYDQWSNPGASHICAMVAPLVNPPRFAAACSKIGRFSAATKAEILANMDEDVWTDFVSENPLVAELKPELARRIVRGEVEAFVALQPL